MDLSKLTDYQLYEIIANSQLDKDKRAFANSEFNGRNLKTDQIRQLVLRHDSEFKPSANKSLDTKYKLLLIIFPFVLSVPIQAIIASKYLVRGQKRKWKDYWFYISLGYLIWTIAIILFCKFFLFNSRIN